MVAEKRIFAGKLLTVDFYPCFSDGRNIATQPAERRSSPEAQQKYNRNQAVKEVIMLVNENFDESDLVLALTYEPEYNPKNVDDLKRQVNNYIRKVKRLRKRELKRITAVLEKLPQDAVFDTERELLNKKKKKLEEPFKYLFTREEEIYKSGELAGTSNFHPHLFMAGGLERTTLEKMWPHGTKCNADRFQPERYGPETMASYIMKDPKGGHSFCCSRTMTRKYKKPDKKIRRHSSRYLENLSKNRVDDREYWEKRYKGYRLLHTFPRYNEYNGHWYMSVVMYATDGPMPKWKFEEWVNDKW